MQVRHKTTALITGYLRMVTQANSVALSSFTPNVSPIDALIPKRDDHPRSVAMNL
jgi:hypothetical protein